MSSASHDNPLKALLGAVAFALRFLGWGVAALVVADVLAAGPARAAILPLNTALSRLMSAGLEGLLVIQTPLGGAFRGDFALLAVILFIIDWAICKVAASLR